MDFSFSCQCSRLCSDVITSAILYFTMFSIVPTNKNWSFSSNKSLWYLSPIHKPTGSLTCLLFLTRPKVLDLYVCHRLTQQRRIHPFESVNNLLASPGSPIYWQQIAIDRSLQSPTSNKNQVTQDSILARETHFSSTSEVVAKTLLSNW